LKHAHTTLYTVGYRDAITDKRLPPEQFYGSLPAEAATIDLRSHPYSPFAPYYTGSGVRLAIERLKPGEKAFYHIRELGNARRDSTGKRISPPVYVDPVPGFARLESILREYGAATIFCACSYATRESATHRCHRFFVAEVIAARIPGMRVVHLEERDGQQSATGD
jgi:hypothetical protein